MNAVVEREGKLGRRRLVAERIARGGGDRRMVETVAFGEKCQQLGHRVRQHGGKRIDALPLAVRQRGRRQLSQCQQRLRHVVAPCQRLKQRFHVALERRPARAFACRQESLLCSDLLAYCRLRLTRQQQFGDRLPWRHVTRSRCRQVPHWGERANRTFRGTGVHRRPADFEEWLPVNGRQRRRDRTQFPLERVLQQAINLRAQGVPVR